MDRNGQIVHRSPLRNTPLGITYTFSPTVVNNWLKQNVLDVRGSRKALPALGLDVEWQPNYVKGEKRHAVAVLQLSTEFTCLVFHIIYMSTINMPERLVYILANQEITKAGCGIEEDVLKLNQDYGLECNGIVDIVKLACSEDLIPHQRYGLKSLSKLFLDVDMEKPIEIQLSNWENFPLYKRQTEYAALDAWISIRLFLHVKSRCYHTDSESIPNPTVLGLNEELSVTSLDCSSRISEEVILHNEPNLVENWLIILTFICLMIAILIHL